MRKQLNHTTLPDKPIRLTIGRAIQRDVICRVQAIGGGRRQRGSAMILAVSAVLILLLIGLGYLSAAQLSRMGSAGVTRSGSTDSAVDETVDLIGRMLAKNTYWYTVSATDADRAGYYATIPNTLYYPWLASTEPTDDDGATGGMSTGQTDGEWRVWKQITRLLDPSTSNTFLPYVTSNLAAVGAGQTDINARRVGAPYWSNGTFVDADGDGVLDSKWTRLPIPGADGMVWIAAVRIVDESGRVNANVATEAEWIVPGTNVLGASPADIDLKRLIAEADFRNSVSPDSGAPNWDDVPGSTLNANFVAPMLNPPTLLGYSTSNSANGLMAEFYHALYGSGGSGFITTNTYAGLLPFTSNMRLEIWTSTGNNLDMLSTNSPFRKLSTDTLADLRRRGGMPTAGWSTLESILDGKGIGTLNPYPSGTAQTGVGPLLAALTHPDREFSVSPILTTNRLKASVRRDITTHSVSRPYRPRWLTNLVGPLTAADVKLNPNFPLPTPTTTDFTELDAVHTAMYQAFSAPETTNYYGGGTQDEARAHAAGMMANLMTYRTSNSEYDPSLYFVKDGSDKYYFGQQKQPFFTEAVAMILYTDRNDADPLETLPGTFIDHPDPLAADTEWTGQYVMVELANPWELDLELTNSEGGFYLVVNSDGTATQTPIPLWDTTNSVFTLTTNARLLVYSRDSLNTTNDAALVATAAAIQPDATRRIEIDGLQWPIDAPQLTFELYYSTNGTTMMMVDRLSYSNLSVHPSPITWPPARIPATTTNTDVGTDGWHHVVSASIQRDDSEPAGTFPRYIYENAEYNLGVETSNAAATSGDLTPTNRMGDGVASTHDLNTTLGITLPPLQLFLKRADLETVGELANVLTIANHTTSLPGVSFPVDAIPFDSWEKTISEQLGSPTTIPYRDNGRLIFTAYVRAEPPRVPIAATLFDQFTLLPGSDLTRGTATPKVFGLINPNTATRRTLEVMPYIRGNKLIPAYLSPDITEPDLARGIIAYRDLYNLAVDPAVATGSDLTDTLNFVDREAIRDTANPSSLMTTLRTDPGFASIGELLMVRREQAGIAPNNNDLQFGMNRQLFDGFDAAERDGDMSPLDTIESDYEEEVLHFNRISNLVTLTSDVFVAHVVLQGRKRDPVTGDYETAVERRFIVGYDRSNVVGDVTKNEKPRVLFFVEDR